MSKHFKSLREVVTLMQEKEIKATLLGVGPMSEVVIRATLELARDKKFPVILIASRNQIDCAELGGGYVMGWDQQCFSEQVNTIADEVGFEGLLYLCRDHGGPWQRDNERYDKLPKEEAMRRAKVSYLADLKAGFNLLHIDPTKDPHLSGTVPMATVIARTIELIDYLEDEAQRSGLSAISYEVGTEETTGGLISADTFERFISELLSELDSRGLPHPAFIVGQTGTLVKMNINAGNFNAEIARQLCNIARQYGLGFKEHNADYLSTDILNMHPDLGITSANVAPEFGFVETMALLELARKEENLLEGRSDIEPSGFADLIKNSALECGRWKKWLLKEDAHLTKEDIASMPEKLDEITLVCGHYVFSKDDVIKARKRLYNNAVVLNISDSPKAILVDAVKEAIMKYVTAFNLKGLDSKIAES